MNLIIGWISKLILTRRGIANLYWLLLLLPVALLLICSSMFGMHVMRNKIKDIGVLLQNNIINLSQKKLILF